MLTTAIAATQAIQAILTPAVMISATALFLLGLNARYVAIITRLRVLGEERRRLAEDLATHPNEKNHHYALERERFTSINQQITLLLRTVWCLRNSILCHISAAIFFVLTSCSIGVNFLIETALTLATSLYLFMTGIILLLLGVTFLGIDILVSFPVILTDIKNDSKFYSGG